MTRALGVVSLALRSALWTVLLPGVVAGYVPWRFFGVGDVRLALTNPGHLVGLLGVALGATILLVCIWEFARSGHGTLSPVDAPRELVVRGLYRYVRNPMYVGVMLMLLGQLLLTRSTGLAIYCLVWFMVVNLFIVGYEEPTLRRRFGTSYVDYTKHVHRWLPRLSVDS